MSSNDIRMAGQKETDIFDERPVAMTQQEQQPVPVSPGVGKFMESSPATSQEEADESVESRISRDPVAHAIVSPAKTERVHDSLADIYLTGITPKFVANQLASAPKKNV
jgi:hypothetical protein